MLRVRSNTSLGPATCPLCRDALGGRERAHYRCHACQTEYHLECAQELGGCSTLGCARQGKPAGAPTRNEPVWWVPRDRIDRLRHSAPRLNEVESHSVEAMRARERPPRLVAQSHDEAVLLTLGSAAGVTLSPGLGFLGDLPFLLATVLTLTSLFLLVIGAIAGDRVSQREDTRIRRFGVGVSKWAAVLGGSLAVVGVLGAIVEPARMALSLAATCAGLVLLLNALRIYTAAGERHR